MNLYPPQQMAPPPVIQQSMQHQGPQQMSLKPTPFEIDMRTQDKFFSGVIHIPFQNGMCYDSSKDCLDVKRSFQPATKNQQVKFDPAKMQITKRDPYMTICRVPTNRQVTGEIFNILTQTIFSKYRLYIEQYFANRGKTIDQKTCSKMAQMISQRCLSVFLQSLQQSKIRNYAYLKPIELSAEVTLNQQLSKNQIANEQFVLNDIWKKNALLKDDDSLYSYPEIKSFTEEMNLRGVSSIKDFCKKEPEKNALKVFDNALNHINSSNNEFLTITNEELVKVTQAKAPIEDDYRRNTVQQTTTWQLIRDNYGSFKVKEQKLTEKDVISAIKSQDDYFCKKLLYKYLFCSVDEKDKQNKNVSIKPQAPMQQPPPQMGYQMNRMSPSSNPPTMNQMGSQMNQMSPPQMSQQPLNPMGMNKPSLNSIGMKNSMNHSGMNQPPLTPINKGQMSPGMGMSQLPLTPINMGQMQIHHSQMQQSQMSPSMGMPQSQKSPSMGMQQSQMSPSMGMMDQGKWF